MSDEKFIVEGGNGPELKPVEVKDHSADPKLTEEHLKLEDDALDATGGLLAVSPELLKEMKPKRGRPKKEKKVARTWRCSTCQETFEDKNVMKIAAGTDRYAVFCPNCQKSLGFEDPVVLETVDALIKNNPTGKNAKA